MCDMDECPDIRRLTNRVTKLEQKLAKSMDDNRRQRLLQRLMTARNDKAAFISDLVPTQAAKATTTP